MTCDLRAAALAAWGEVEPTILTPLMNPAFAGGPAWPAFRQGWRVARREDATLIMSDGLSDPFDDETPEQSKNGFEIEVYAITREPLTDAPQSSWLMSLVYQMSQTVAHSGAVAAMLERHGTITTDIFDVKIPEPHRARFVTDNMCCVLVNLTAPEMPESIDGPLSPIRLANVKLLTVDERAFVMEHGDEGRVQIVTAFERMGKGGLLESSLDRPSILEGILQ
jgi:hypothetical protein